MPLNLKGNNMPGKIIQDKLKIYGKDATLLTVLDCTCPFKLPQLS